MTYKDIMNTITTTGKGTFHRMTWSKELKTLAKYKDAFKVEKESTATVRFGVQYDNMKSVQGKRESGELPQENAGLPWGEWKEYPYTISHKGNEYLRASITPTTKIKTVYKLNGKEVDKTEIEKLVRAESKGSKPDVLTVNIENIKNIK